MIPVKAKILLIEGNRADRDSFAQGLIQKGYQVDIVSSGSAALANLAESMPALVVVDTSSMRTSGSRICHSIREKASNLPILLIVAENSQPADKVEADVILSKPFTLKKLVNRIRHFLPVEQKHVLKAGPLMLDTEQRLVRVQDRQVRLTPRLVALLRILMANAGDVIERKALFSQVWETAYTDDTRTLDVHISWLRQALEVDPRRPQWIKTVRGVGYRLDVDKSITRPRPPKPAG